jgi:aminoglycoside phosphotransferase (APT) family kinase protein
VLEVLGQDLFVKVVRPSAVAALVRRHELLAPHLPVPQVLHSTDDGVVVLPRMPGASLRTTLGGPTFDDLEALLGALPPAVGELPPARDPLGRVDHFAAVLALTVPEVDEQVRELVTMLAGTDPGEHPVVPVHGDLHEAQVLVDDDGAISGLLDVDTAGAGHRVDDWACLLAHLSVLGTPQARRYGAELLATAETRVPRAQLRPRIAAAVLGLATGPYRVQQRDTVRHTAARLTLARNWITG